ncbi:hypothetical protein [Marinifilum caeruleilacunae]|uniref:Uncharacterized protein n=1 Tax=Marinifilum caeruleilacunae TaxID=2499076 RepID=A0ABX1X1B2_9BACT|nr:hypothetical protein [Marinifilum caeruleilacunae]NOU61921.1 hypothetical protein [Marinifilum caeruleilacunae]
MKIIKQFSPNEFVFDNLKDKKTREIILGEDNLKIEFNKIIDSQFLGGNIENKYDEYKDFLGLGIYSKAPCGGFINFYKIRSVKKTNYVIYSGINEVSNSHYVITIHMVLTF